MNKRIAKKLYRQFNGNKLGLRKTCMYCCNWGLGCANGHPAVYPGDRSDYLNVCKEKLDAFAFFEKQLKREGLSLSGWKLVEIPILHQYVFQNNKRHKDITVVYEEGSGYSVYSTDMYWKYSKDFNMYKHKTIKEALKAPWQHWNFVADAKNI